MPNKRLTNYLRTKTVISALFSANSVEYHEKRLKAVANKMRNARNLEGDLVDYKTNLKKLYVETSFRLIFSVYIRNILMLLSSLVSKPKILWNAIFMNESIVHAPGSTALNIISFVFSKKATEGVFMQVVADMREEHADALHDRRFHKARWIVFRDHVNLLLTVVLYLATSVGKRLVSIWKIIP